VPARWTVPETTIAIRAYSERPNRPETRIRFSSRLLRSGKGDRIDQTQNGPIDNGPHRLHVVKCKCWIRSALAGESAINDVLVHSITYWVAVGPRAGEKAFTLQTLPPVVEGERENRMAQASGFPLHAGVAAEGGERGKLERLCRYVSRPALSTERLALTGRECALSAQDSVSRR